MLSNLPPGVTPKMVDAAMGDDPDYERIEEQIVAELKEDDQYQYHTDASIHELILARLEAEAERAKYGWEL